MTEKEAAMTGFREFRLRMEAYSERQRVEWERARWMTYHIFSPFVKKRPSNPKAWVRFPWEKADALKVVKVGEEQEKILNQIYMDFMSRKNNLKS